MKKKLFTVVSALVMTGALSTVLLASRPAAGVPVSEAQASTIRGGYDCGWMSIECTTGCSGSGYATSQFDWSMFGPDRNYVASCCSSSFATALKDCNLP